MALIMDNELIYSLKNTENNVTLPPYDIFSYNKDGNDSEQLDTTDVIENNIRKDALKVTTSVFTNLLQIPNWTFTNFINERTKFIRQGLEGSNPYNDTGSFFYKIFFNFNTSYGLFGSLLKLTNNTYVNYQNTAITYLENNINSDKFSNEYKAVLKGKQKSLESFAKILNYLSFECPWFFKEVGGLADATKRNFKDIDSGTKSITLTFNSDAVDMRISTLLDLYVNACYDTVNFKEVIPENLRKFDIAIILFNPPIANLNKPVFTNSKTTDINKNKLNWANIGGADLTYKCLILKNCEIDINELSTTPEVVNNENPFTLDYTIKINYLRSYVYNINNILNIEMLDNMFNIDDFNQVDFIESLKPKPKTVEKTTETTTKPKNQSIIESEAFKNFYKNYTNNMKSLENSILNKDYLRW